MDLVRIARRVAAWTPWWQSLPDVPEVKQLGQIITDTADAKFTSGEHTVNVILFYSSSSGPSLELSVSPGRGNFRGHNLGPDMFIYKLEKQDLMKLLEAVQSNSSGFTPWSGIRGAIREIAEDNWLQVVKPLYFDTQEEVASRDEV